MESSNPKRARKKEINSRFKIRHLSCPAERRQEQQIAIHLIAEILSAEWMNQQVYILPKGTLREAEEVAKAPQHILLVSTAKHAVPSKAEGMPLEKGDG